MKHLILVFVAMMTLVGLAQPVTTHRVHLQWNSQTFKDWSSYKVYKAGSDGNYSLVGTVGAAQTYFNDVNVVTKNSYSYFVTVYDHKTTFESAASNVVGVTIP